MEHSVLSLKLQSLGEISRNSFVFIIILSKLFYLNRADFILKLNWHL